MMTSTSPHRIRLPVVAAVPLLFSVLLLLLNPTTAKILWPKCDYEVEDRAGLDQGDFYDLCIQDHEFNGNVWSWKMTKASILNTKFNNCTFRNQKNAPNNFTGAYWKNVEFNGCNFGSWDEYGPEIVFDDTKLENVRFVDCVFDHTIRLKFSQFDMTNVQFENCVFRAGTLFELGLMTSVMITNSRSTRLDEVELSSEYDPNRAFKLLQVSVDSLTILKSNFVHPLRLEGVNARFLSINESSVNKLFCSGEEVDPETDKLHVYRSGFNDSVLYNVTFDSPIECAETTWRNPYFSGLTFYDDADFSRSTFEDLYVDGIRSTDVYHGDCHTLNFSASTITRKTLANVSVDCKADFHDTVFTRVRVKNFYATHPDFRAAVFSEQEYVDGNCCSRACVPLKCLCNVTYPSGLCPVGDSTVNISRNAISPRSGAACFPGQATVHVDGSDEPIQLSSLSRTQSVHVGNGEVSPVMFFGHRAPDTSANYVQLVHEHGTLHISPGHYLYVNGALKTARSVQVGDTVTMGNDESQSRVSAVMHDVVKRGLYAPMTVHGDIVVDGVSVSSYTDVMHPTLARRLLRPFMWLYSHGYDWPIRNILGILDGDSSFEHVARWAWLRRGPAIAV